jgi:hypothetical protein
MHCQLHCSGFTCTTQKCFFRKKKVIGALVITIIIEPESDMEWEWPIYINFNDK